MYSTLSKVYVNLRTRKYSTLLALFDNNFKHFFAITVVSSTMFVSSKFLRCVKWVRHGVISKLSATVGKMICKLYIPAVILVYITVANNVRGFRVTWQL